MDNDQFSNKKYQKNNLFSSSTGLILISFALIFLFLKFGILLVINLTSFVFKFNPSQQSPANEIVPRPLLYYDYEATNSSAIVVNGKSFSEGKVKLVLNGKNYQSLETDKNSEFSLSLSLPEGKNEIYAVAENKNGQTSSPSEILVVLTDLTSPSLEILSPANESHLTGNNQRTVTLSGRTDENAIILVNNRRAILKKDGFFEFSYYLSEGENKITVSAKDEAGNITEKELLLFFNL
ncbi:MAG: Bacillopeptidase F precursor [Microgenomates group bacterium ADurb.Bin219]|nr:MAG: Bacillopeptidase F precursor [Microgenomates group bacterium ADurb.Bin219]HNP89369.1 hypothetical protein [Candidatus Woesebacteria bacterium]